MIITVLAENTSQTELPVEHGLSLYIETAQHRILFDMGQSQLFAENAERLGIDLRMADIAVISHGHYDHGGGLKHFLQLNAEAPVYVSKYAFEPHYNADREYIGLDPVLQDHDRLTVTDGTTVIGDGLTLYSYSDRPLSYGAVSSGLYTMEGGHLVPDDFRHEQYLLIREAGKKILISGCSHKGILNIMSWFHPDIFVGGFHLFRLPADESLRPCANRLSSFAAEYYTCHCTGTEQYAFLRSCGIEHLQYISTGQRIVLPGTMPPAAS